MILNLVENNKKGVNEVKVKIIILAVTLLTFISIQSVNTIYADSNDFSQADFNRVSKGDKNLINAKLEKADLQSVDLSCANLQNAELDKANLQNVNLAKANLQNAELEGANLQNADLTKANLQNADLEGANLKGAKINGANFKGAELGYVVWTDGRVCAEDSVGSCW